MIAHTSAQLNLAFLTIVHVMYLQVEIEPIYHQVTYICFFQDKMAPKKILKYSEEQMQKAIEDVNRGLSKSQASKINNVPRPTLISKLKGQSPLSCRMGRSSILKKEEESLLVDWIFTMAKAGFPITKVQLIDSVQRILVELKRENPFTNGRPGRKWYNGFLTRNPQLAERMAQNLTKSRADVTETNVKAWFTEVYDYLKSNNMESVLEHPERIFNADETAFF